MPTHPALREWQSLAELAERQRELAGAADARPYPELTVGASRERGQFGERYGQALIVGVRIPLGNESAQSIRVADGARRTARSRGAARARARAHRGGRARRRRSRRACRRPLRPPPSVVRGSPPNCAASSRSRSASARRDLPTRLRVELEAFEAERQAARSTHRTRRRDLATGARRWACCPNETNEGAPSMNTRHTLGTALASRPLCRGLRPRCRRHGHDHDRAGAPPAARAAALCRRLRELRAGRRARRPPAHALPRPLRRQQPGRRTRSSNSTSAAPGWRPSRTPTASTRRTLAASPARRVCVAVTRHRRGRQRDRPAGRRARPARSDARAKRSARSWLANCAGWRGPRPRLRVAGWPGVRRRAPRPRREVPHDRQLRCRCCCPLVPAASAADEHGHDHGEPAAASNCQRPQPPTRRQRLPAQARAAAAGRAHASCRDGRSCRAPSSWPAAS